ncbi:MAG: PIN domain-containing protein [Anaerolineae bacterium]|nr:PIN domain-containing protein [Anaerolineae bacterium]MDQ7036845.1 PIN domain-containing protein [Anaerolineae bacterium]
MGQLIYIIDTNVIADLIKKDTDVIQQIRHHQADVLCLCQPVDYEVRRGLLHKQAQRQIRDYETHIRPQFQWVALTNDDWQQAAQLWAQTHRTGRQFADTDLLIAAIAKRLNGIVVTADDDFDALSIRRENWRKFL